MRPNQLITTLIICSVLLCPAIGLAGGPDVRETPEVYEKEGPFVRYPARGAYVIMFVPAAIVGSIICLPVAAVRDRNKYWNCALGGAGNVSWAFAGIVGAPFYGLKKAFWDGPKFLFKGKQKPSENQAEQQIECAAKSMTACYERALNRCPQGYVLISEASAGAKNQMVIRCKPTDAQRPNP